MAPSSLSNSSSSSGQGIKPARLRAACNLCHNAKIRCSGERDGCSRCRNNNLLHACKYSVSRVGRASGKKQVNPSITDKDFVQQQQSVGSDSTRDSLNSSWDNLLEPAANFDLSRLLDEYPGQWAQSDTGSPNLNLYEPYQMESDPGTLSKSVTYGDFDLPHIPPHDTGLGVETMDFDLGSTFAKSPSTFTTRAQATTKALPPVYTPEHQSHQSRRQHHKNSPTTRQPASAPMSSHAPTASDPFTPHSTADRSHGPSVPPAYGKAWIAQCTQIITYLGTQSDEAELGLDGVLSVSKCCMSRLLQLVSSELCQSESNCMLLLCIALHQMITLFETQLPVISENRRLTSDSTGLPSLLFGSFEIDEVDQLAFCNRLIVREIRRCKELLEKIHSIYQRQKRCNQQQRKPLSFMPLQAEWFKATTESLDALLAAVTH